jgi:hypothetical protein
VARLDHLQAHAVAELAQAHARSLPALLHAQDPQAMQSLLASKALVRHAEPTLYMHRQVRAGLRCTGVIALVQAGSFTDGVIRAHRHASPHPAPRHAQVQVDPVIVAFEDDEQVLDLIEREVNDRPLFHVLADDGATHTLWAGTRSAQVMQAFQRVGGAMVLEGHRRVPRDAADAPVLTMLVPMSQVQARASLAVVTGDAAVALRRHVQSLDAEHSHSMEPPAGFADVLWRDGAAGVVRRRCRLPAPNRGSDARAATAHGRLQSLLRTWLGEGIQPSWRPAVEPGPEALTCSDEVVVALPRPAMAELAQLACDGLPLPAGSTWFEPRIRSGLCMAEHAELATTIAE